MDTLGHTHYMVALVNGNIFIYKAEGRVNRNISDFKEFQKLELPSHMMRGRGEMS